MSETSRVCVAGSEASASGRWEGKTANRRAPPQYFFVSVSTGYKPTLFFLNFPVNITINLLWNFFNHKSSYRSVKITEINPKTNGEQHKLIITAIVGIVTQAGFAPEAAPVDRELRSGLAIPLGPAAHGSVVRDELAKTAAPAGM